MKAHSVKSNAKRHARRLAEAYPALVPAEPQMAVTGFWYPAVETEVSVADLPAEVTESCVVIQIGRAASEPLDWSAMVTDEPIGEGAAATAPAAPEPVGDDATPAPAAPEPVADISAEEIAAIAAAPAVKSTPEEIRARLAERRARLDASREAHPVPAPAPKRRGRVPTDWAQRLLAALAGPMGITAAEAGAEFGWVEHSARARISVEARKAGVVVTKNRVPGRGTVYQITSAS